MSTRCHVAFYEKLSTEKCTINKFNVCLYFHSDGYPRGILPSLVPFLIAFNKERGLDDTSYAGAWCMSWMIKDRNDYKSLEEMSCLSHGIVTQGQHFQSDIEYLYEVHPDKFIVNRVIGHNKKDNLKFESIGTIDLLTDDKLKQQLEMILLEN